MDERMGQRLYPINKVTGASPEFGMDANSIKTKVFDLSVAHDRTGYEIAGNVLWAITSSSPAALIEVRLNDQLRDPLPVQVGLFIKGVRFSRIFISNAAQPGQTITFLYCVEEFNNIVIENPAGAVNQVDISKATNLDSVADVVLVGLATTQILPALGTRRAAMITNLTGNVQVMRIGDAAAAAGRGTPLDPGESIVIETTEAIYGYKPIAGNENVAVIWTTD